MERSSTIPTDKANPTALQDNIEDYINTYAAYENMVQIPAGEFYMGCNTEEAEADAKPQHRVIVEEFSIDQCVVTNEEYQAFVLANPEWRKPLDWQKKDANPYYDAHYLSFWTGITTRKGKVSILWST